MGASNYYIGKTGVRKGEQQSDIKFGLGTTKAALSRLYLEKKGKKYI